MLLKVSDLKTYFKTANGFSKAVDGISFEIREKEIFCLVGESGCGKSVTALSIMQLVPEPAGFIAGGEINFQGKNINEIPESQKRMLRGNEMAMIFQEPMTSLNPVLTIGYQLMEPLIYHKRLGPKEARSKAMELLSRVQIPDPAEKLREYPFQLSGGMKQRVMIAMSMACQPRLLIADEPTTALDVTVQAQILAFMKEMIKESGTSILFITHDLAVVQEIADRVAVMYAGQIVETGERAELLKEPLHPYTSQLIKSVPKGASAGEYLETIQGRVPPAYAYPEGCRFRERCNFARDICAQVSPPLIHIKKNHYAACLIYNKKLYPGKKQIPKAFRSQSFSAKGKRLKENPYLKIENLKIHFPIKKGLLRKVSSFVRAVDGVDLEISRGETLALVGESGCGKTTLGRAIMRLVPVTNGTILLNGKNLTSLPPGEFKPYRQKMQIIFQDPYSSLDPKMMVGEILKEPLTAHNIESGSVAQEQRVREILGQVGLEAEMTGRYPHEFSGGQRQRIGIARSLILDPEFIICDEATSSLDVSVQAQILNLLNALKEERGLTYLFITHNLGVVEYIATSVAVMYLGRIVEKGKVKDVFQKPLHPYTQALLAAVPRMDRKQQGKKIFLEGEIPSAINPPRGCHFHPRCVHRMDICFTQYPAKTIKASDRIVHCHLFSK
jgi:peptide/nickel transport system ATP-binding protein